MRNLREARDWRFREPEAGRRDVVWYAIRNIYTTEGRFVNFITSIFVGYRLRETDNRINRTKHRQQPLNRNKQQADTALTERNAVLVGNAAVAPQSLSMKELRRKGLTKYDAELLIAQGCRFSDINQQQPAINNGENMLQTRPHPSAIATSVTRSLRNKQLCKFDGNTGDGNAIKNTQSLRASR